MRITIEIDGAVQPAAINPAPAPGVGAAVESTDGGTAPSTSTEATTADGFTRSGATGAGSPPAWLVAAISTAPRPGSATLAGAEVVDGGTAPGSSPLA